MPEIVLDTETTGLSPKDGDRVIEIGCVELDRLTPTGRVFHKYIDPERDVPAESVRIHGLTRAFLADKPVFAAIAEEFTAFIGDTPLVAHNAQFDIDFINMELGELGLPAIGFDRVTDTLALARRRFPGAQVSLDALCRRFDIDLSGRGRHGALLDAELLARVYLELRGGRQPALELAGRKTVHMSVQPGVQPGRRQRAPRSFEPTAEELAAHAKLLGQITDPIWHKI